MGPPEKEVADRNQYVFGDTNSSPVLRIRVSKAAVPRNLADIQFGCLYKVQYWWIRHSSLVQKCYPCFGIIFSLRGFSLTKKNQGPAQTPLFGIFGPNYAKRHLWVSPARTLRAGMGVGRDKGMGTSGFRVFWKVRMRGVWCFMITPTDTTRQNIQKATAIIQLKGSFFVSVPKLFVQSWDHEISCSSSILSMLGDQTFFFFGTKQFGSTHPVLASKMGQTRAFVRRKKHVVIRWNISLAEMLKSS